MDEIKLERVKRLAGKTGIVRAVKIICGERIAKISHMDPDLVGAACFQVDFQKRMRALYRQTFIMGDCGISAIIVYPALYHRRGDSADRGGYRSFGRRNSLYHRQIGAADFTISHLTGQKRGAERILGKYQCA